MNRTLALVTGIVAAGTIALGQSAAFAATSSPAALSAVVLHTGDAPAAAVTQAAGLTPDQQKFLGSLPQVRLGQRSGYVLALQGALRQHGFHGLEGTGYFGGVTDAAVKKWQQRHGIVASGLVGPQTWTSLLAGKVGDPRFTNPNFHPGQRWPAADNLSALQAAIANLSAQFDWAPDRIFGTHYTGDAVTAVQQMQVRSGIPASGIIGPRTTAVLNAISMLAPCHCN